MFKHVFDPLEAEGQTPAKVASHGGGHPSKHTTVVKVTGSPDAVIANLEGSLDGTDWFDLSGAVDLTVAADRMFHVVNRPVQQIRYDLTTLTGGTDPTVQFEYLGIIE
jgi:hypothetical protein